MIQHYQNFQKQNLMPQLHFKKLQVRKPWERERKINCAHLMRNSSYEMHWHFNMVFATSFFAAYLPLARYIV